MRFKAFNGYIKDKNGNEVFVREVSKSDNENFKFFFNSLSERSRKLFVPHCYTDDILEQYIERAITKKDLAYLAFDGDKCIGYFFLWYFNSDTPILGIGTNDNYQGCGLGQAFMDILITDAKKENKNGIELTTMLDNEAAFAVYKKKGFNYIGNVENTLGTGEITVERRMFLPLRKDAYIPEDTVHSSPV